LIRARDRAKRQVGRGNYYVIVRIEYMMQIRNEQIPSCPTVYIIRGATGLDSNRVVMGQWAASDVRWDITVATPGRCQVLR
jgi:hypothetical protein